MTDRLPDAPPDSGPGLDPGTASGSAPGIGPDDQPIAAEQVWRRWSDRLTGSVIGGLSAAVGVAFALVWFYPLGRRFDPTVGGDQPVGLATELVLGLFGGLIMAGPAFVIGGIVGAVIKLRRLGVASTVALVLAASALATLLAIALNGSPTPEFGDSTRWLGWPATLGALAGASAVAVRHLTLRSNLPQRIRAHLRLNAARAAGDRG